jgi:N-carbamoyl-L-amino-acid hydrolase
VTVRQSLAQIGYAGKDRVAVPSALIELHVEGSNILFDANEKFGVFTRFWGATKYRLAFLGLQAHTGPTPMALRKDALLGAAYLIADLKQIAGEHGLDLHTSVGRLEVFPNSPNTVPSEAVLFIELRSASAEVLAEAERR